MHSRVNYKYVLLISFLIGGFGLSVQGQDNGTRIETLLAQYHTYDLFNGSVLVAEEGEVVYKGGFGEANMSWNIKNTPDTKFRIGSVTKQFTAALILQLAEEGKLELEATVTDYLPEYPASQGVHVAIHQLLTHTSGIPSYTELLGFMSNQVRKHQAAGYVRSFDGYERAPYLDTSVPYAAGMMYSTVEDLYHWDRSLYNKGPFKQKSTLQLMFKRHIEMPDATGQQGVPTGYGYGWLIGGMVVGGDTVRVIEHGGGIFGFSTGF